MRLALPVLAERLVAPGGALGAEAIAARAAFDAHQSGELAYFAPVADLPGFPRAVARTLSELQLAGVDAAALRSRARRWRRPGHAAGARAGRGRSRRRRQPRRSDRHRRAATAGRARRPAGARRAAPRRAGGHPPPRATCSPPSSARRPDLIATVPLGDARHSRTPTCDAAGSLPTRLRISQRPAFVRLALDRLRTSLFASEAPPAGDVDDTVHVFSAPGEGREAVEIARRVLRGGRRAACRSTRWRCCCARRRPTSGCSSTPSRAPASRRGSSAARAAPIRRAARFSRCSPAPTRTCRRAASPSTCRSARCHVRRRGLTPMHWSVADAKMSSDDASGRLPRGRSPRIPRRSTRRRPRQRARRAIASSPARCRRRGAGKSCSSRPYVIEGLDRWQRRLPGLRHEYERRLERARRRGATTRRARRPAARSRAARGTSRRSRCRSSHELDGWRDAQHVGRVARPRFDALAPRVLRQPARVLRVLAELAPLGRRRAGALSEVREVLAPRLLTLTHEPPRRRHGRVFVGTPQAARGRAFRVVFVPGLAERVFPQRLREDALLLDARRAELDAALAVARHACRRRAAAAAPGGRRRQPSASTCRTRASSCASRAPRCRRSTCST